jgi:hypothetical protein
MEARMREPQMGLTFEKVWAALMEMREESKETDQRLKETDRLIRELRESQQETARVIEETSRELRESRQETARVIEETSRELRESQQETARVVEETSRELRESQQETDRVVKETSKSVGGLNNSFGELAEHLVAPNIKEKFNALGYHFKGISRNQRIENEQGQIIAEIDILLENSDYIVAVEVKSKPKNADIENFARRLEILRKFKNENQDKRRIRGAIAGAVFHDPVKKAVLEAGFYVIEQAGDTVKINVPEGFEPKEW